MVTDPGAPGSSSIRPSPLPMSIVTTLAIGAVAVTVIASSSVVVFTMISARCPPSIQIPGSGSEAVVVEEVELHLLVLAVQHTRARGVEHDRQVEHHCQLDRQPTEHTLRGREIRLLGGHERIDQDLRREKSATRPRRSVSARGRASAASGTGTTDTRSGSTDYRLGRRLPTT